MILRSVEWQFLTDVLGQTINPISKVQEVKDLKIGPIGCPETSVRNYHYTVRKIPEGRRSHLRGGRSLKLSIYEVYQSFIYSPSDAVVSCLQNSIISYIKIYIKTAPICFDVTVTPPPN